MNKVRFEASAVQYNDDIYVFNGFGFGIRIEPTVEKYDAGTKQWTTVSSTSVTRGNAVTHNGLVRVGNEVWIIGGRVGSHPGRVTADVWIYNLDTGNWKSGPSLPTPIAAGGAALVNNKIHWFGGIDANARCDVANHFVYDLNQRSAGWKNITNVAAMPSPRNHFSTVVHNGLIYAMGGQHGHDACPGQGARDVSNVHVFNPANNSWATKANLPTRQSHAEPSSFVYGNAIYVIGGEYNGTKIFRYNPAVNNWDTVATLPNALLAPVARVVDDRLIVASGGAPNSGWPSNKVYSTSMTPMLLPGQFANSNNNQTTVTPQTPVIEQAPDPVSENPTTVAYSQIFLEAAYFDAAYSTGTHEWVTTNLANASNNAAIVTTPDTGMLRNGANDSPMVSYFANFDNAGKWYVWIRGWGDTNSNGIGSSDSLHAGLNGGLSTTANEIQNFPGGWSWSRSTRDNVNAFIQIPSAGVHTINLWMREDGLAVDKILLTNNPNFTPTGTGPTQNVVASVPVAPSTNTVFTNVANGNTCNYSEAHLQGGWGWDPINQDSCPPVENAVEEAGVTIADNCDYSQAHLSDGWGWDPVTRQSCAPVSEVTPVNENICDYSAAHLNGGWGWNYGTNTTCAPAVDTPTVENNCDYSQSNLQGGWGWDPVNLESCAPL